MAEFPRTPRLTKGAIVGIDPFNPLASVVVFQYNPELVTRTVTPRTNRAANDGARAEPLRLMGPPDEKITLDVELDAADQLEQGQGAMGLYPTLSAIEMLVYPKSALVIANEVLANLGILEVVKPDAPLTLFIWGVKRVVPVRLTSITITEQEFDPSLNPIRAKVGLSLEVLNYDHLGLLSVGGALFMAHQVVKEVMATIGSVATITGVGI